MSDPEQIITLKDVYTQVTMLVGQQQAIIQRNMAADLLHTDHEQRLRALERWRYALPASFVIGLGGLATAVGAMVGKH